MAPLRAWDTDRLGRLRLHRRVQLGVPGRHQGLEQDENEDMNLIRGYGGSFSRVTYSTR